MNSTCPEKSPLAVPAMAAIQIERHASRLSDSARQKAVIAVSYCLYYGGEGGIRTHGTRKGSTVFETARFNRSRTSPYRTSLIFPQLASIVTTPNFLSLPRKSTATRVCTGCGSETHLQRSGHPRVRLCRPSQFETESRAVGSGSLRSQVSLSGTATNVRWDGGCLDAHVSRREFPACHGGSRASSAQCWPRCRSLLVVARLGRRRDAGHPAA